MIKDKNILITGGNSGIGFFTTINLLKTQNNLYIPIRSLSRKEEFLFEIRLLKITEELTPKKNCNSITKSQITHCAIFLHRSCSTAA